MAFDEALDTLGRILRERYNVHSLDGVGGLGEAIATARGGDLSALDAAMAGREMYRWHDAAQEALAAAHTAAVAKGSREKSAKGKEKPGEPAEALPGEPAEALPGSI